MAHELNVTARRATTAARFPAWPGWTLADAFDSAADQHPDRPLFTNEQGTQNYGAMQDWSRRLASGLMASGIQPGDHVALLMANYAEFVAVKLAIARVGAVTIPVNFNLRGEELRYVLDQSDAVALIVMDQFRGHDYLADLDRFAPTWRSAGGGGALAMLRDVFVFPTQGVQPLGARTLDDLIALGEGGDPAALAARTAAIDPHATCDVLYTSGTTGRSKGVILTHDMILRVAYSSVYHRALSDGRSTVHALPMYHVYGYVECLVVAWFVGGAVVTQLVFDPVAFMEQLEKHHATDIIALPNQTIKLLEVAADESVDTSSLVQVFNSGGVNPPGIWDDIRRILKPREVITAYGMSETTASSTTTLPEGDDRHLVSNGCYKLAHVAGDPTFDGRVAVYKVIDPESGVEMPHGEIGELVAKGPIVTSGYYRKPEETAAAFTADGWLHSGDLGRVSADGYLTLTGRLKESYRCGGEMVMPREIEALVETLPQVELALAVGVPDPRMGDVGCLCIVAAAGHEVDPTDLIALCSAQLARFKVPRHVLFFAATDIPMTSTGRPQKVRLAQIARDLLERESLSAAVAARG